MTLPKPIQPGSPHTPALISHMSLARVTVLMLLRNQEMSPQFPYPGMDISNLQAIALVEADPREVFTGCGNTDERGACKGCIQ